MFAANGSTANGDVVWSQTINVTPNQNYIFSVFHSAWSSGTTAVLGIRINGTVLDLDFLDTGSSPGVWSEEDRFVFYSGNSSTATIDLVNSFAGAAGRDFALDDISVTEIESPHSLEEIQDLATELAIAQADANLQPCIDALTAFGLPPFLVDIICNGGHDSAVSQAANHTGSVWEGFFWPLAQNPDLHPHEVPNVPPDCDNAGPSQDILWPPNHKFHSINVVGVTDADGDTVIINIDSISQDEPVNGKGDGNTSPDGQGVGTDTAEVRAERSGTKKAPGDGRVYHISFTASDGNGGSCSGEVTVGSTS